MAREAGFFENAGNVYGDRVNLKAFEAFVRADERNRTWTQEHWTEYERSIAAKEREGCADLCDEAAEQGDPFNLPVRKALAAAIRARGQA
jgi:hypothetical protein